MIFGELNEQQIINVISSQAIGRLACSDGKYPYIIPMSYAFDGNYIIAQSFEGKKIDIMRRNPFVCFQTDMIIDMYTWQSILAYGIYEELHGEEALAARELLIAEVMPLMTPNMIHAHEHLIEAKNELSDNNRIRTINFRIHINEKSGRYSKIG